MSKTRGNSTRQALVWSFLDRSSQQGLQFLVTIILARMLAPSDVGVIGLLALFIALAQSLIDSGFGQAITQMRERDPLAESAVFYFNLAIAVVAIGALWWAAPTIAAFFDVPILVPLTRFLSFNLLLHALSIIQTALLTKALDFRAFFKASLLSILVSGPVSIFLAYSGFGVWSLAWQTTLANLTRVAVLWYLSPWRPLLKFRLAGFKKLFGYASRLLFSGLIDTSFKYVYQPLIGKLFSSAALGYYSLAVRIPSLPAESLTTIVSRVTFPKFSEMQDDPKRLRGAMRRALTVSMLITTPILVGLLLVAGELVRVALSAKWMPSVPMLRLYCLVVLLLPFQQVNLSALLAVGRADVFLRLELIKKALVIATILVTWQWGVLGLLWGQIVISVVSSYLNSHHIGRQVQYPFARQMRDLLPLFAMAGAMALGVVLIGKIPFPRVILTLLVKVSVGALVFIVLALRYRRADVTEVGLLLRVPPSLLRALNLGVAET